MTIKRFLPAIALASALAYLATGFISPHEQEGIDVAAFSQLPILNGGRVKPLDTLARNSLLLLRGKQTIRLSEATVSADAWLLDMLYRQSVANAYPTFEIDDPDVLGMMGMVQTKNRYYTFTELRPHLKEIEMQARQAEQVKAEDRTRYQTAVSNFQGKLVLYQKLQNSLQPSGTDHMSADIDQFMKYLVPLVTAHMQGSKKKAPPELIAFTESAQRYQFMKEVAEFLPLPGPRGFAKMAWVSMGQGILDGITAVDVHPGVTAYAALGDAWRGQDASAFTRALTGYRMWLETKIPSELLRARAEYHFNRFEPFYKSMVLYVVVFLLAFLSLLFWPETLIRAALWLIVLAFSVHTVGLITRMILQGRPPVTNLYSSAIFVGWMAVLLGMVLEKFYRNGIGSMVASAIGFSTLIIAHHLASQGDSLEMMRAVLDSNFWLATHVVCITIGYSSTFLSGFLASLYILRRWLDAHWSEAKAVEIERMVYGIVCFSLFFSFLGTILGGIWADQSWGRFWGWDPKENGALMIVLWNAFILHARWGKVGTRDTLMQMAVFGNIVTACSWFGVNMLGIGLHSYGFMQKAFVWLVIFAIIQALVIAAGGISEQETRRHGSRNN